jgi:hypothetical protein
MDVSLNSSKNLEDYTFYTSPSSSFYKKDIFLNSPKTLEDYTFYKSFDYCKKDFTDDLLKIVSNHNDQTNKYKNPLQWIIFEYAYSKCYDCNIILDEEEFKCNNCDIVRCKFHMFVNTTTDVCIECQNYKTNAPYRYSYPYKCIMCRGTAYVGYMNKILFCTKSSCTMTHVELIDFSKVCQHTYCRGTGWFKDKVTHKTYCCKHKNENCGYTYYVRPYIA